VGFIPCSRTSTCKNPEKRLELNDNAKKNIKRLLYNYKRSAGCRNIDYNLTDEEATELMNDKCFYCYEECTDGYKHGIDRKYNDDGYEKDNCVTCCKMCNISKNDTSIEEYINKVFHILSHT